MIVQHLLDLFGIDVVAAGYDQILAASDDLHIAVFVNQPQIAGDKEPVRAQFSGGFFGHLPIALENIRAAYLNNANLSLRQGLSGFGVANLELDTRQRRAHRAPASRSVIGVRRVHIGLRHPVAFQNAVTCAFFELLVGFRQQRRRA